MAQVFVLCIAALFCNTQDAAHLVSGALIPLLTVLHAESQRVSVCVSEGGCCLGMSATQHMKGAAAHPKAALTASRQRNQHVLLFVADI